jgi:hypothetical protein
MVKDLIDFASEVSLNGGIIFTRRNDYGSDQSRPESNDYCPEPGDNCDCAPSDCYCTDCNQCTN